MKRFITLFLAVAVASLAGLAAQAPGGAVIVKVEGTATVLVRNVETKAREGLAVGLSDIIRAGSATVLLSFPAENLYGVVKGAAAPASACVKRPMKQETVDAVRKGGIGILEGFLGTAAGTQPGGPRAGGETAAVTKTDNVNLVVILDVSYSMRHEFTEMQSYIHENIVRKAMKDGDYLCIFTFGVDASRVFEGTLSLPADEARLKQIVYGIKPQDRGTDIGLMLEKLDELLKSAKLPHQKTTIFWVTDGKNDPPWGSRYLGKDVYDPNAFDAYKILKSAAYKVLLLSIGGDTAAQSLGDPLGGQIVEVKPGVTADALDALLGDMADSIEMMVPESLGAASGGKVPLDIAFLSTYDAPKDVDIEKLSVSIDGGEKKDLPTPEPRITVGANDVAVKSWSIVLPAGLSKGQHVVEVELAAANNAVSRTVQRSRFEYRAAALPVLALAGIGVGVVGLLTIVAVLFFMAKRRREREDEEKKKALAKEQAPTSYF